MGNRNGKHRQDDPFAEMEKHFWDTKGMTLPRKIHYFCYLERAPRCVVPTKCVFKVRGPAVFW